MTAGGGLRQPEPIINEEQLSVDLLNKPDLNPAQNLIDPIISIC